MEELTNEQIKEAIKKFEEVQCYYTTKDLETLFDKGDARTFPDYDSFFTWLHEESDVHSLIKLLKEGRNYSDEALYVILEDETIVFIYS